MCCVDVITDAFSHSYPKWLHNKLISYLTHLIFVVSAANSINWGRLLPQVLYHVSGYLEMVRTGQIPFGQVVDLCVPTGNFGNILSAYYAKVEIWEEFYWISSSVINL